MYALKNTRNGLIIIEIEKVIKLASSGRSTWVILKDFPKPKTIRNSHIYETKEDAEKYLKDKREAKVEKRYNKQIKFEKEQEKINEVMNNIWKEFGVSVKFLSRPCTEEDAQNLYIKIKDNKNIRDMEIW